MASAVNTVWRDSSPDSVDADLAALWLEAGKQGPVSRALMSNLVVVSPRGEFPDVEPLARKHPARTIFLSYRQGVECAAPPEAVRIGLRTFDEGDARRGLELIAVRAACADRSIPSIVRRLTAGDVPTTVWWACDLSDAVPPDTVTTLGRRLVYDSALWRDVKGGVAAAAALVERSPATSFADLNWRRTAALREGLARAFRTLKPTTSIHVSSARVVHASGQAAAGWLIAGWLTARLKGAMGTPIVVEEHDAPLPLWVSLSGEGWGLTASMTSHQVEVKDGFPAFTLPVPQETEADSLASELVNAAQNQGLRDALLALNTTPHPTRGRSSSA